MFDITELIKNKLKLLFACFQIIKFVNILLKPNSFIIRDYLKFIL